MKKVMFAILAIAAIAFTGCSKDEDSTPSLTGTVWIETDDGATRTLTFTSSIECRLITTFDGSTLSLISDYTYEYNHPIVMAYPKTDDDLATLKGIIDRNTMNVINTSTEETIAVMTKQ